MLLDICGGHGLVHSSAGPFISSLKSFVLSCSSFVGVGVDIWQKSKLKRKRRLSIKFFLRELHTGLVLRILLKMVKF